MDQPPPADVGPALRVRRVEPDEDRIVELISTRMRLTLAEVLDPTRADEMFTDEALRERVRWHLDREAAGRRADVFVAEDDDGILGHTMVRVEHLDGQDVGLFATTYVDPASRRSGVASALLTTGEKWMSDCGMTTAVTFTDPHNDKLLSLYARHGYTCERIDEEWARATRRLQQPPPAPDTAAVEQFFTEAVAAGAVEDGATYSDAGCFGDTPALADSLIDLVLNGPKRATAGSLAEYDADGVAVPAVGDLFVATDGRGRPRALLRTTEVRIGPLSSVDERFAWDEGEGDRTREDWLRMHTDFFTQSYERLGLDFHSEIPVVFERFEVAHPT